MSSDAEAGDDRAEGEEPPPPPPHPAIANALTVIAARGSLRVVLRMNWDMALMLCRLCLAWLREKPLGWKEETRAWDKRGGGKGRSGPVGNAG
jgi:hypothetical protein